MEKLFAQRTNADWDRVVCSISLDGRLGDMKFCVSGCRKTEEEMLGEGDRGKRVRVV